MMGLFLVIPWLLFPQTGADEYMVVTSIQSRFDEMTAWQLKQVYLGKLDRLNGVHLVAVELSKDHPPRRAFDRFLFRDPADLENYWLTHKLRGDANPPMTVGSWALVVSFVKRNPGFIGYIPMERARELDLEAHGLKQVRIEP